MKTIKLIIFSIFLSLLFSFAAYAQVGETLSQMTQEYGSPTSTPLKSITRPSNVKAYDSKGASAYIFKVNGFRVYAAFNSSGVCYKVATYNNRVLPSPALLIGSLANTKPVVLSRIPLRALTLQYGSGANMVIFKTSGLPGSLSAEAWAPSLKP